MNITVRPGVPKKVSIKTFNSDLLITLIHSYSEFSRSVSFFGISFIRFRRLWAQSLRVKLQGLEMYMFCRIAN